MNKRKSTIDIYSPFHSILQPYYKEYREYEKNKDQMELLTFISRYANRTLIEALGSRPQYNNKKEFDRLNDQEKQKHRIVNQRYIDLLSKIAKDVQNQSTSNKRMKAYKQLLTSMEEDAITGIYRVCQGKDDGLFNGDHRMNSIMINYIDGYMRINGVNENKSDQNTISNTRVLKIIENELNKRADNSNSSSSSNSRSKTKSMSFQQSTKRTKK